MKPLFPIVVAILVIAAHAHPENIEEVKELAESKDSVLDAEESQPQARKERCSACSGTHTLKSHNDVLAALQSLPNAEVHTQQSFEECSSEKGCAGIKLKDGKVIQKFGNLEAFKAAASADTGNEFQFQTAGNAFGANGEPFWWMNQNSPFKNAAGPAGAGHLEKFSKFQSSSFSTSNNGAGGVDIAANPFLNGDFSKLSGGFTSSGGNFAAGQGFGASGASQGAGFGAGFGAGQGNAFGSGSQSNFASNSQSSFSGAQNGFGSQSGQGLAAGQGLAGQGLSAQGGLAGGQGNFNSYNSASKFASTGYTGSSPAPFASGANVNLIQNSQKSDYDFEQQQQTQQNIDEVFQSTGNVQAQSSGGDLQQTCAGQGYVCVLKAQCNNGVVNTNGRNLPQASTQKQYCNTRTEVCCRLETASLGGAFQGNLGVGSATFTGSSNQGSGVFAQTDSSQNAFGATGFGSSSQNTNSFNSNSNSASRGTTASGFGATNQFSGAGSAGNSQFGSNFAATNKFAGSNVGAGFGSTLAPLAPTPTRFGGNNFNNEVFKSTSQSNFVETDSFSSGSENAGVYRPGASGSGLKPGIPYLPPLDSSTSGSNVVSTAFVTSPRPYTPRPVTPRPVITPRPYIPPVPSTSAPGYLPPVEPLDGSESRPNYVEGGLLLDDFQPGRTPAPPVINRDVPSGCAAALKCTPIEFCTAEGVMSNTTVVLTRDQEAYRVPLTDCKDLETGRIGKCCRDPFYTDPWPVNQLGKWVPEAFGDGKYVPDNRGSGNVPRPVVTARPPVTGSVFLNNFRTTSTPLVTPAFTGTTASPGSFVQKTQVTQSSFGQGGRGQYEQGGRGVAATVGQGQFGIGGQGQYGQGSSFSQTTQSFGQGQAGQSVTQGQGAFGSAGRGQLEVGQGVQTNQGGGFRVTQGGGQVVRQGSGFGVTQGIGQTTTQERGTAVTQGFGTGVRQDQGFGASQGAGFAVTQGQGSAVLTGQGLGVTQGQGNGILTGQGIGVSQGQGLAISQGQGGGILTGQGLGVSRGQGIAVTTGQGQYSTQGQGQAVSQGAGFEVTQGNGFGVQQGQGSQVRQGAGFGIQQGNGFGVSQGNGFGFRQQGGGFGVSQGTGFGVNYGQGQTLYRGQGQALTQGQGEQVSQESVQRVFLSRYTGSGQCGLLNPQKPYGNRKDLEMDFAEIPWQAMVLLQTNRSLLCGGVITRPDVVVTSASCVEGLEAKNVLIKGGEWKLGIDDEPLPFQIVQVKTILRHPQYKSGSLKYDAAILVLTENLRLAKNIWPICLPSASDELDAFYNGAGECIVTGWGKTVLQAHLQGSIMHGLNVSLINPDECQDKIQQDYPHLLDNYEQDSCVCGQPLNPANNICKVDTGSALACTTGDGSYVMRGIYSWESGCQAGNQLAGFYKFDIEWYEWAIGLIESVRFAQYTTTQITKNKIISQVSGSSFGSGIKGGLSGVKGTTVTGIKGFGIQGQGQTSIKGFGLEGQSQSGEYSQFGKFSGSGSKFSSESNENSSFGSEVSGPLSNTFSATFTEKKFFQTEPKYVTYTTKPEIVTFTTKPEYFTYTTKPKIVTYTTKPEIVTYTTKPEIVTYTTKPKIVTYTTKPQYITYETSGSVTNPKYVSPSLSFSEVVGAKHQHSVKCNCLNGKK